MIVLLSECGWIWLKCEVGQVGAPDVEFITGETDGQESGVKLPTKDDRVFGGSAFSAELVGAEDGASGNGSSFSLAWHGVC